MVETYCVYARNVPALPECQCERLGKCQFWRHVQTVEPKSPEPAMPQPRNTSIRAAFNWIRLGIYNGQCCPYCTRIMHKGAGRLSPSRDHLTPLSRGGANTPTNRVIACVACNGSKGNWLLSEWLTLLRRQGDPRAAHVAEFIKSREIVKAEEAA